MSENNTMFIAYDGDGIGNQVGRAVLKDNVELLSHLSATIREGHEMICQWAESMGGTFISGGGDEGIFTLPVEALEQLEEIREQYYDLVGATITVGIGSKMSEAGKALIFGKLNGKDQIVQYDVGLEEHLKEAHEHAANGSGSEIEEKYDDAYLDETVGDESSTEEMSKEVLDEEPSEEDFVDEELESEEPLADENQEYETEENEELPVEDEDLESEDEEYEETAKSDLEPLDEDEEYSEELESEEEPEFLEEESEELPVEDEEEILEGGVADSMNEEDFDAEALAEGIEVEMEHTDDEETAKEIAMDHLAEDPEYYIKLREVEDDGDSEEFSNDETEFEEPSDSAIDELDESREYPDTNNYYNVQNNSALGDDSEEAFEQKELEDSKRADQHEAKVNIREEDRLAQDNDELDEEEYQDLDEARQVVPEMDEEEIVNLGDDSEELGGDYDETSDEEQELADAILESDEDEYTDEEEIPLIDEDQEEFPENEYSEEEIEGNPLENEDFMNEYGEGTVEDLSPEEKEEMRVKILNVLNDFKMHRDHINSLQQENPELYASQMAMLQNMIDMAHALGLSSDSEIEETKMTEQM